MAGATRYDGIADWYDERFAASEHGRANCEAAIGLLGDGPGRLLDVGCGGGLTAVALAERGWTVTGVDVSEAQVALAHNRGVDAVVADATSLPFGDASFDGAISIWTHTDIDDFAAAVREVARVLRAPAPFVYLGVHPCFVGPHSLFVEGKGLPQLFAGYRVACRYEQAPGISPTGLRAKVGATHLPLAPFLHAFLDAGFVLERVEEPGRREYPIAIALRWRR